VHAASLAQLVNVIAPIMTEPGGRIWRQTTFHPFALTSRYAVGQVLRVELAAPVHDTHRFGETPLVDAVATHDPDTGAVAVFMVNRSVLERLVVDIDVRAFAGVEITEALTLSHPDPYARASVDDDGSLVPVANGSARQADGVVRVELPPVSWTLLRLAARR